jgi:hypothetical protein
MRGNHQSTFGGASTPHVGDRLVSHAATSQPPFLNERKPRPSEIRGESSQVSSAALAQLGIGTERLSTLADQIDDHPTAVLLGRSNLR